MAKCSQTKFIGILGFLLTFWLSFESFDSWLTNWVKMIHLWITEVLLGQIESNQVSWNPWVFVDFLTFLLSCWNHDSLIESKWLIYWYFKFYLAYFNHTKFVGSPGFLLTCWLCFWVVWLRTYKLSQNDSFTFYL